MSGGDFTRGFMTGFLVALLVVLLAQQLVMGRLKSIIAFFQPQATIQKTSKSPFQTYLGCITNIIVLALVGIVLILLVREYYGTALRIIKPG